MATAPSTATDPPAATAPATVVAPATPTASATATATVAASAPRAATAPEDVTAPEAATAPATAAAPGAAMVLATGLSSTQRSLSPPPPSEMEDESVNNDARNEDKSIEPPKPGMIFSSFEELFGYYRKYGIQEGFGIRKRTSSISSGGKNVTVVCTRAGKPTSSSKKTPNLLKLNSPITQTECKARLNATIWDNGLCRLNSIVLEHNHGLSPIKSRLCNRELSRSTRRKLVVEVGGRENVLFLGKDCRNSIEKERKLRLGLGDAEAIHKYFVRMQDKNSNFFYLMNVDDDARVKNLFWADARSRAAYEEFGDVITFDTTYLTNKYDLQLVFFVGVNHHGQSILLGCGLLSNEDTETFTWLFQSWLSCMSGRAPKAIITDQHKTMQKAIENVFPNARHCWCLWHIMSKLPEKLGGYSTNESIKTSFQNVVYNSLTTYEFEESWRIFIEKYNLEKNEWLCALYDGRHRWAPAFVNDTFWAGMSTTQCSESMSSFFDGYVNSKTTLKQFFEQYDNALKSEVEKESLADIQSIPCVTHYEIEKQFQEAYTAAKFREFQEELTSNLYCDVSSVRENGEIAEFEVSEDVKIGERRKKLIFMVSFNAKSCDVQCMCCLFNFRGILCRHAIAVLLKKQVEVVPSKYILPRWRKDIKRCYTRVKTGYDDWRENPQVQQYDKLHKSFNEVADLAVGSDDKCNWVLDLLTNAKDKLKVVCRSNQTTSNL